MHYTVKAGISSDLVADADLLMREFYRADRSINNLDQNNIKSASINYDTTYDPSKEDTCKRGTTRTHLDDASDILYASVAVATFTQNKWLYGTGGLSFNLPTPTPFSIYVSGKSALAQAYGPMRYDGAIFYNGEMIGVRQSFSGATKTAPTLLPFFLTATVLLPAGDCDLVAGFRQYTANMATISSIKIAAIGYPR